MCTYADRLEFYYLKVNLKNLCIDASNIKAGRYQLN